MIAHMLNVAVGLTFSGGFLDLFLFGILQGNAKTSWLRIIPVGIIYFFLYYGIFTFMIKKFNFKTPGREDDDEETKLYTKADVNAKNAANPTASGSTSADPVSETITRGLGGKANITGVDCCATRLRLTVVDSSKVNEALIKSTGSRGIIIKGQGVQIIYGPQVTVIKAKLETYLETAPDTFEEETVAESTDTAFTTEATEEAAAPAEESIVSTTIISSPITGLATALENVPDEGFAGKMMGDGAAVTPEDATICAPEDGEVVFVFDTKHAIGFQTDSGVALLLHIGIDTVNLNGEGFQVFVENGQKVKKGEPLMKIDIDFLKSHAPSLCSPVLCTELTPNQRIRQIGDGEIKAGEPLFAVETLA